MEANVKYQCLDPRGLKGDIQLVPPADRLDSLAHKTVYFVDIGKRNSDVILKKAMQLLEEQFDQTTLIYYPKLNRYMLPESKEWWNEIDKKADAAVVAVGD